MAPKHNPGPKLPRNAKGELRPHTIPTGHALCGPPAKGLESCPRCERRFYEVARSDMDGRPVAASVGRIDDTPGERPSWICSECGFMFYADGTKATFD